MPWPDLEHRLRPVGLARDNPVYRVHPAANSLGRLAKRGLISALRLCPQ